MASGVLAIRRYNMFPDLLLVYDANEAAAVPKNNEKILAIYNFELDDANIKALEAAANKQNNFVLYVYGNDNKCADGSDSKSVPCPTVVAKQLKPGAYIQFIKKGPLSDEDKAKLNKACHAHGTFVTEGSFSVQNNNNSEASALLQAIMKNVKKPP